MQDHDAHACARAALSDTSKALAYHNSLSFNTVLLQSVHVNQWLLCALLLALSALLLAVSALLLAVSALLLAVSALLLAVSALNEVRWGGTRCR
jgi:hypothetical protein